MVGPIPSREPGTWEELIRYFLREWVNWDTRESSKYSPSPWNIEIDDKSELPMQHSFVVCQPACHSTVTHCILTHVEVTLLWTWKSPNLCWCHVHTVGSQIIKEVISEFHQLQTRAPATAQRLHRCCRCQWLPSVPAVGSHTPNSSCDLPVYSPSIYPCTYNWNNFHHIPHYQHLLHHWNILKLKPLGKEEHCFLLFSKSNSFI